MVSSDLSKGVVRCVPPRVSIEGGPRGPLHVTVGGDFEVMDWPVEDAAHVYEQFQKVTRSSHVVLDLRNVGPMDSAAAVLLSIYIGAIEEYGGWVAVLLPREGRERFRSFEGHLVPMLLAPGTPRVSCFTEALDARRWIETPGLGISISS